MFTERYTCGRCGKPVDKDAWMCPHCGVRLSGIRNITPPAPRAKPWRPRREKSPYACLGWVVAGLSIIIITAVVLFARQGSARPPAGRAGGEAATQEVISVTGGETVVAQPLPTAVRPTPLSRLYERALAGEFRGKRVSFWVYGQETYIEYTLYQEVMTAFTEKTGIEVELSAFEDDGQVDSGIASQALDLASFTFLEHVVELASTGKLIDPRDVLPETVLRRRYEPAWLEVAMLPGPQGDMMAGVWHDYMPAQIVFYARDNFDASGFRVPATWEELIALSDRIVAEGGTPWCVTDSLDMPGWITNQWLEEIILRTQPIQTHEDLASGKLACQSPQVAQALERLSTIWFQKGYVNRTELPSWASGPEGTAELLFTEPPQCWLYLAGSYGDAYFPEISQYGVDYDWFLLPPIEKEYGQPQVVWGSLITVFQNRPEVGAVLEYLTLSEAVQPWMEHGIGLSPHADTPLDWYAEPYRRSLVQRRGEATSYVLSFTDLMPDQVREQYFNVLEAYIEDNRESLASLLPPTLPPPTAVPSSTAAPSPTSGPPPKERQGHIADLLAEGSIAVDAKGRGIDELDLNIENLTDELLDVEIPAGTYFVASSGGVQNMVVRESRVVEVDPDDLLDLLLDAACANMERDVPTNEEGFSVQRQGSSNLARLMPVIEEAGAGYIVAQAAVWIVTDNASYADLGTLVSGFAQTRVIHEDEAAQAMRLVDQAGLNITGYSIWADRNIIASGASPELAEWLRAR